ncbi:thiamine pyrophosphate-binding protein [Haloferax sp. MBLA0076]|uniref:Thiamine pyrophosphate-binding protein n=1 Tax=Haloferax litoreum TaxID=2666140 RepID=A0A6A8GJZ7_9EURY|nr:MULTISPECIES: thiamine pyrophosphate-binding protein [Haloferax]KAB1190450.1 thiamine pyrophosphate-binding protein [Haloferax sp. CBA1148]MRX23425.1 thiamine pyrophosphate-binding protein [Haloferax litoreum]
MSSATHRRSGADLFVEILDSYGVSALFGNPGTTELPLMNSVTNSNVEYVLALHEDVAVGMAAGYAKSRYHSFREDGGELPIGVVNLHLAPGLLHGLGNVYAAKAGNVPLVVTAGAHSTDFRHEEPILHGELPPLAESVVKWSAEVRHVDSMPTMLRRAFRVALTPPTGPVFLSLPLDVMLASTDATVERLGSVPTPGTGSPADVDRATQILVEATDPVVVFGDGVSQAAASEEAIAFAEASGARVHGEILSCEVNFPADHPAWAGYLSTNEAEVAAALDTDTVVLVGCSTNTTAVRHEAPLVSPETKFVHVSEDAWQLGKNEPADASILGDPKLVLSELSERVESELEESVHEARTARAKADATAMKRDVSPPEEIPDTQVTLDTSAHTNVRVGAVVEVLRELAPDAYLVDESVTAKGPLLSRWPLQPNQRVSNKGGGLGYGLPAALGAALAVAAADDDHRPVVGLIGDGSFLYYPHALFSAARYDLNVTIVVFNNGSYRILKKNSMNMLGGDEADFDFEWAGLTPSVDYVSNAESFGVAGFRIDDRDSLRDTLAEAVQTDGPTVVDVNVAEL